jgi:hypothetical protein
MRDIIQCHVSGHLKYFKNDFMKRWGFVEYTNIHEPVVFFGCALSQEIIQKHQGFKIIFPAGPSDKINWNIISNRKNLFVVSGIDNFSAPKGILVKHLLLETKDYSLFKPNVLGNKIYYYSGFNEWKGHAHPELIRKIQDKIGYEIITTQHMHLHNYFDIVKLKKEYYDKVFLCLNLRNDAGMTTTRELGLMGRKTIMNTHLYKNLYKGIIPWKESGEDIIRIINEEAKKIGTIQPSIQSHTMTTDAWLHTSFWANEKHKK